VVSAVALTADCHAAAGHCPLVIAPVLMPRLAPAAGEDDEAIAARAEWEASERRRLEPPRLVLLRTQSNQ